MQSNIKLFEDDPDPCIVAKYILEPRKIRFYPYTGPTIISPNVVITPNDSSVEWEDLHIYPRDIS